MGRPQRWNDWVLLIAIGFLAIAPIFSTGFMLAIENPLGSELQADYEPHGGSGPGHFFPLAMTRFLRVGASIGILCFGVLLGLIGSIKIPRSALGSRRLRDATWIMSMVSLAGILASWAVL